MRLFFFFSYKFLFYFFLLDLRVHSKFDNIFDTLDPQREFLPSVDITVVEQYIYSSLGTDLESFASCHLQPVHIGLA